MEKKVKISDVIRILNDELNFITDVSEKLVPTSEKIIRYSEVERIKEFIKRLDK